MLYEKLMNIYKNNSFLNNKYNFKKYYIYLQQYLNEEVNLMNDYISPYRFSKMFNLDLKDSIEFFLAISSPTKTDFIQINYKYTCEECGSLNYYDSEEVLDNELECKNCDYELYGETIDTDIFVLVFELSEEVKEEFKSLKVKALSKDGAELEGELSLTSAQEIMKEKPEINPELSEKMKRIERYRGFLYG